MKRILFGRVLGVAAMLGGLLGTALAPIMVAVK
jgi:hypothetical protein